MKADPIGLYVHIPFCVRKCNYCDFCSFAEGNVSEYIDALCKEADAYRGRDIKIDTVFFGGGTPSLLSGNEFRRLVRHIKEIFDISDNCEFTLEANPKTLNKDKLSSYISEGVNRISLGLQSIHENELKILGRIHNYNEFLETCKTVKSSGISNINIDLMYGIPEQTSKSFEESLLAVLSLEPTHISLYGLILEEGTQLFNMRDTLIFPNEDEECDMYYNAQTLMSQFGYSHYEISNYSKRSFECRHNLKYWRDEEYIGLGLAAYSYFDGKRFGNTTSMSRYLSGNCIREYDEVITDDSRAYEYVMLRTRLREGFSLSQYQKLFGIDFLSGKEERVSKLVKMGYVRIADGRFSFTDRGMYVSNTLLTELT